MSIFLNPFHEGYLFRRLSRFDGSSAQKPSQEMLQAIQLFMQELESALGCKFVHPLPKASTVLPWYLHCNHFDLQLEFSQVTDHYSISILIFDPLEIHLVEDSCNRHLRTFPIQEVLQTSDQLFVEGDSCSMHWLLMGCWNGKIIQPEIVERLLNGLKHPRMDFRIDTLSAMLSAHNYFDFLRAEIYSYVLKDPHIDADTRSDAEFLFRHADEELLEYANSNSGEIIG